MRPLTILSIIFLSLGCNTTKKNNSNSDFKNQKLIINDSTYTFTAESVDNGILKYDGNKMDIYGREGINAGKHFITALTKMENGQMIICYNLAGDRYPGTFDTKGKPTYLLSVFEKEKAK